MEKLGIALRRAAARRGLPAPSLARALREQAGLAQVDVARALGVSRSAVSRWEGEKRRPRDPKTCVKYATLVTSLAGVAIPRGRARGTVAESRTRKRQRREGEMGLHARQAKDGR